MHHRVLATLGTVAVLGAAGGGLAVAKDRASSKGVAPAASFQRHLASDLGVSPDTLQTAAKSAAGETVDDLVAAGKLDAAKAAKAKARIAKGGGAAFARFGTAKKAGGPRAAGVKALATVLKLDRKDLVRQLHSGKAPADVIAAHHVDRDVARQAVLTAVRAVLDKRVQAGGTLTTAKADERAAKLADRLTGTAPLTTKRAG